MKIQKDIFYQNKHFTSLSDDSIEASSDLDSLFVKTKMNERYQESIAHLPSLSAQHLKDFFSLRPKLIGITGTNGKTTTAGMIAHSLQTLGYQVGLLGTRGCFIQGRQITPKGLTTPTILELYALIEKAQDCDFFVMEVSSHAITQERILGLEFEAKVLTNITSDHLDFHSSLEEYINVKNSFFDATTLEIINADEPNAKVKNALTYALSPQANVWASEIRTSPTLQAIIHSDSTKAPLQMPICGKHNLYNALATIATIQAITPYSLQEALESLKDFQGIEGRMEVVSQDPLIIVDFAHTHDGMEKILEGFAGERISVVFGAGGDRDKSKRPKMGEVAQKYATKIYLTSDNPRSEDPQSILEMILEGISERQKVRCVNPNRQEAISQAIAELQKGEILFVLGKGDETYQIIGHQKIHFDDREVIKAMLQSHSTTFAKGKQ